MSNQNTSCDSNSIRTGSVIPKPSIMARAKGYGTLNQLLERQAMEANADWRPVPGFPEYEVTELRQVRRKTTGAHTQPYKYMLRPDDGEFVDFWINGQKLTISLDAIMSATFPKEK